ncbi:MAG TPA: efflux RND transporter periplasmic adaptor subunit [Candidatus Binataceae bacterium]|nr:efflux RND transporter periplasmic adaptor subunit [Candidatus Binataceae bacterium]
MRRRGGQRRALRWLLPIALAVALAACHPASDSSDENENPEVPNTTMVVSAARAEVAPMEQRLQLLGKTVATHHVIIRAPTAGRVIGMKLVTGDWVAKGQVVAYVLNREIEAAEDGLAVAQKIEPENAERLAQSVHRYTHSPGIAVRAPDAGIVSQPPVTTGQVVGDLDTLVDLIDPRSLYVEANVPLSQLHALTAGMQAEVLSPLRPGSPVPARIVARLPTFDTATATSTVRLDFTGSERILEAGSPVLVHVVTRSAPDAIVIPEAAVFQDPGPDNFHVFTIGADKRARRTDVSVGVREGDRVQITNGIKAGELVITSGGYALSDGLRVEVAQGTR